MVLQVTVVCWCNPQISSAITCSLYTSSFGHLDKASGAWVVSAVPVYYIVSYLYLNSCMMFFVTQATMQALQWQWLYVIYFIDTLPTTTHPFAFLFNATSFLIWVWPYRVLVHLEYECAQMNREHTDKQVTTVLQETICPAQGISESCSKQGKPETEHEWSLNDHILQIMATIYM